MVRNQILGLTNQLGELTHPAVAESQLPQKPPTVRVGDQLQELLRGNLRGRGHLTTIYQLRLIDQATLIDRRQLARQAGFCWGSWFRYLAFTGGRVEALSLLEEKRALLPRPGQSNLWDSWTLLFAFTEGLFVLGERDEPAGWHDLIVEARSTGAIITSYIEGMLLERVAGIAATAAGNWDAAEAHFLLALRQADELPHQLERLETRRFYAQMLTERAGPGDRDRARKLLDEALDGFTRLRMPRHADLARNALVAITP